MSNITSSMKPSLMGSTQSEDAVLCVSTVTLDRCLTSPRLEHLSGKGGSDGTCGYCAKNTRLLSTCPAG